MAQLHHREAASRDRAWILRAIRRGRQTPVPALAQEERAGPPDAAQPARERVVRVTAGPLRALPARTTRRGIALSCLAVMLFSPTAVRAEDDFSRWATLFDQPTAIRRVPTKLNSDPLGELRCTYYSDLMVRETGTDSPGPGPASIIPISPSSDRQPACDGSRSTREASLKTAYFSLVGRKGRFLVFSATNPNGAAPFVIMDAGSGRLIYSDGTMGEGFRSAALEGDGALRLRFTRGVNGSCSIIKDAACWARMAREGKIPRAVAQSPPPVQACVAGYGKDNTTPADDPSIVAYDVDMTLDRTGRVQVNARGAVECYPMP